MKNYLKFPHFAVFVFCLLWQAQAFSQTYTNILGFSSGSSSEAGSDYMEITRSKKTLTLKHEVSNDEEREEEVSTQLVTKNYKIVGTSTKNGVETVLLEMEKMEGESDWAYILATFRQASYTPFVEGTIYPFADKTQFELFKKSIDEDVITNYTIEVIWATEAQMKKMRSNKPLPEEMSKADFKKMLDGFIKSVENAEKNKEKVISMDSFMYSQIFVQGYNALESKNSFRSNFNEYKEDQEIMDMFEKIISVVTE